MASYQKISKPGLTSPAENLGKDPSCASHRGHEMYHSHGINSSKAALFGWPQWMRRWRTYLFIVGSFLLAFALAFSHYIFFSKINHQPVEQSLKQSYVTYISLLFTTAFRAVLIGSTTTSFTQYLWSLLRKTAFRMSLIEKFFLILHNPFTLFDLWVFCKAPVLFTMAVLIWLAPLATIYPPGALTVTLEPWTTSNNLNISVKNPRAPVDFDPFDMFGTFPHLFTTDNPSVFNEDGIGLELYVTPNQDIRTLSQSIVAVGKLAEIAPPSRENSSYTLTFRAPQLKCDITTSNVSLKMAEDIAIPTSSLPFIGYANSWNTNDTFSVTLRTSPIGHYTILNETKSMSKIDNTTYIVAEVTTQKCKTLSALFTLTLSYAGNEQHVEYSASDHQPTQFKFRVERQPGRKMTNETWKAEVEETIMGWNVFALLDSSMSSLVWAWNDSIYLDAELLNHTTYTLPSEKAVKLHTVHWQTTRTATLVNSADAQLQNSIFNTARNNNRNKEFMPPRDLNLTEAMLNQFLANVSISAISLGTWRRLTPVNITNYRNVYTFSSPQSLILPYLIALSLSLLCNILGIWALSTNGEVAENGGFLQIMTTTRGNTEMDQVARKINHGREGGPEKELLDLKIRYGEMVEGCGACEGDEKTISGFGTIEETVALKWRKPKGRVF